MEKTAIQSSSFASTMGIPDSSTDEVEYPNDNLKDAAGTIGEEADWHCCRNDYDENDDELIAKASRTGRKTCADEFRAEYIFGRCMDQKTCIWRGDRQPWSAKSSGITWVGVHGNDFICVVTKAGVLDVTRVHGFLLFNTVDDVECLFRRAMISDMEDLADPASKPHELRDKSINKPFGVVSVVRVTNKVLDASDDDYNENKIVKYKLEYLDKFIKKGEVSSDDESSVDPDAYIKNDLKRSLRHQRDLGIDDMDFDKGNIKFLLDKLKVDATCPIKETVQESSDMCDENGAIEFLGEKMKKSVEHFTLEETIKTAISAFQRLFNRKFEAKDIGVCVMDPNYFVLAEEAHLTDTYVQHLEENEIEKYLSDLSEPEATQKRLKCYA